MGAPWKLRIDWTCWSHRDHPLYAGSKVEVWLDIMDEEPRIIRTFDNPPDAAGFCRRYINGRGCRMLCDPWTSERLGWTFLTIHAGPSLPESGDPIPPEVMKAIVAELAGGYYDPELDRPATP